MSPPTQRPSTTSTSSITDSTPILSYEYHVGLPNTLMLVDAQGRRTGKDPATGIFYHEIPGTSYSEIGTPTSSPQGAGELLFNEPIGWQYTIYVIGGPTSTYWFDSLIYKPFREKVHFSGPVQSGSMVSFVPQYDSVDPASTTLLLQGITSSTNSVIGTPAHNLP